MPKVFDTDIVETSETLGPGTYTLEGPRVGYRSFDEAFDTGDTPYYVVRNALDTKYEHNRGGVFTSGTNTLTRSVYLSSNGNAPVSWVAEDHPLLVYQPSATEIFEDLIRGWRSAVRSVWMQFGIWWRSDFPSAGKDTMMYYNGTTDIALAEVEGGSGYFLNKPPGEYVDVAYPVTAGAEPSGTLIADGAAISRTTFSKLFAKVGTNHGAGNGTTTFNKPDARGRNRIGRNNQGGTGAGIIDNAYYTSGNVDLNGSKGGSKGHTGGVGVSVSVNVSGSIGGSTFGGLGVSVFGSGTTNNSNTGGQLGTAGGGPATPDHTHNFNVSSSGGTSGSLGVTGSFSGSGSGSGGTSAFTVMQPGIIVDTLITTGGQ